MDPVANPFYAGGGTPPPTFYGRDELLRTADISLQRLKQGTYSNSLLIRGLRGVGKTVILGKIAEMARNDGGFQIVEVESPEPSGKTGNLLSHLVPRLNRLVSQVSAPSRLRNMAQTALKNLALRVKIGIPDLASFELETAPSIADTGDLENDVSEMLISVAELMHEHQMCLVLLIDEMQYLVKEELAGLCLAMHRVNQRALPVRLFGAGLPQLAGLAGAAKSYAERLFDYPEVGPLPLPEACASIRDPFQQAGEDIDKTLLQEVVRSIEGYPYFLQVWGRFLWDCGQPGITVGKAVFDRAGQQVENYLDNSFYSARFDRLTNLQRKYLRAMADLAGPLYATADIAGKLSVEVTQVAPTRNQLIALGMIYSPQHGKSAFTVPNFDKFMRRKMPNLEKHIPVKRTHT